jgi:hypothetical protein
MQVHKEGQIWIHICVAKHGEAPYATMAASHITTNDIEVSLRILLVGNSS